MVSQIVSLFNIADHDEDAFITWEEVVESLEDPRQVKEWVAIGVQPEDARYLFKVLDVDEAGEVTFEEFMGGCLRINGPAKSLDLLTVMQEQRKNSEVAGQKLSELKKSLKDIRETMNQSQQE